MTSEVVVMNNLAVALAADSAATVTYGGDSKVYNSACKLFMLTKRHPVGVMVYSNAAVMGVPWETIIKMFRQELADKEYARLEQYGEHLISYLNNNSRLFPQAVQDQAYLHLVETLFGGIAKRAQDAVYDKMLEPDPPDVAAVAKEIIGQAHKEWSAKKRIKCFDEDVGDQLITRFSKELQDIVADAFGVFGLQAEEHNQLRDLASMVVVKEEILSEIFTGIVIAGFGRDDHFPVMVSYDVGEVYMGRLKHGEAKIQRIGGDTHSVVQPFAQKEMVETFLHGINPRFEYRLAEQLLLLAHDIAGDAVDGITDLTDLQKKTWKKRARTIGISAARKLFDSLADHRNQKHFAPIRDAIRNLPKDELAHVAASLVNLNSFQKRLSPKPETVGGPVDVAVISKGDGFIWIERKHYFRPELNHHFFRNYHLTPPGGTVDQAPRSDEESSDRSG